MQITDLAPEDTTTIEQVALILLDCFGHLPSGYLTLEEALEEVHKSFASDYPKGGSASLRISRIAIDDSGVVLGWIGGIQQYDGNVWELYPLIVKSDCRGQGIGRLLVADLEVQARQRGGVTLWLGTDDEEGKRRFQESTSTPIYGSILQRFRTCDSIPMSFTRRVGLSLSG